MDPSTATIYEVTFGGVLVRKLVLDASVISTDRAFFSSITMAPSSDPNDNSTDLNYWVADRHVDNRADPLENDGLLYELDAPAPDPPLGLAKLTLKAARKSIRRGGSAVLRGRVPAELGTSSVVVQRRREGAWRRVGATVSGPKGRFVEHVRARGRSRRMKLRATVVWGGVSRAAHVRIRR